MTAYRGPDGGMAARRAVVRWAWRLFRREWRQQLLVVGLIAVAITMAVGGVTAAYNMASSGEEDFGTANQRLTFDVSTVDDPSVIEDYLDAAEDHFVGGVDMIGERTVEVPGSVDDLMLLWQDPNGTYSSPMLRLSNGRYPTADDEVALTDEVAETFGARVDETVDLDGQAVTVVGLVENPADLDEEFALAAPWAGEPLDMVTVLFQATDEELLSMPPGVQDPGPGFGETRPAGNDTAAASGALAASALVLALVGLIAAAAFVVLAQRRLRQLGMLAATGATQRQVRMVVIANGALVGAVAAVVGTVAGIALWAVLAPGMETVAGHRIDDLGIPVAQVVMAILLAVVASGLAAWWPARTLARVPITRALSGRPPTPRRARRSLLLALALLALGVAGVASGVDATNDTFNDIRLIPGILAITLGVVLLAPVAVRSLAPLAGRLPITARLALRDLARYQSRAGAALAAISLGLGIAVAIVIAAAARTYQPDEGNLSDRQLLFRTGEPNEVGTMLSLPELTPDEVAEREAAVEDIAESIDGATVLGLDVPVDPAVRANEAGDAPAPVMMGRPVDEDTTRDTGPLYLATLEVLDHLGVDPASIDPGTAVVTEQSEPVILVGDPVAAGDVEVRDFTDYSREPRSLLTLEAARDRGWDVVRAAWLVAAPAPLTDQQIVDLREAAATADVNVEVRQGQEGLAQLRWWATGIGVLLALGILATTVGLVRSEAAADLRTLTATGATSHTRRSLTSLTAGTLALLGAALGTLGAYAGLGAGYNNDPDALLQVPWPNLAVVVLGCPLLAAAAGWLLAGRQPPTLARTPIE